MNSHCARTGYPELYCSATLKTCHHCPHGANILAREVGDEQIVNDKI